MLKRKAVLVSIANPKPGAASYTSLKQAEQLIKRGHAVYEGSPGKPAIRLIDDFSEKRAIQQIEIAERHEKELLNSYRSGAIWWNGADTRPHATHLPFTSSVFPRVA